MIIILLYFLDMLDCKENKHTLLLYMKKWEANSGFTMGHNRRATHVHLTVKFKKILTLSGLVHLYSWGSAKWLCKSSHTYLYIKKSIHKNKNYTTFKFVAWHVNKSEIHNWWYNFQPCCVACKQPSDIHSWWLHSNIS